MPKVYAIKKGHKTGIFTEEWDVVKKYVSGYPGAVYQSFKGTVLDDVIKEAKDWLGITDVIREPDCVGEQLTLYDINIKDKGKVVSTIYDQNAEAHIEHIRKNVNKSSAVAYTDGSYSGATDISGIGLVFITSDADVIKISESIHSLGMWQILGETEAVLKAVNLAIQRNKEHIEIRYDYEGVAKWATGEWKAKTNATRKYQKDIIELSKKIKIDFYKVDAHSGDALNDLADQCAKCGCETQDNEAVLENLLVDIADVLKRYGYEPDNKLFKQIEEIIKKSESDIEER